MENNNSNNMVTIPSFSVNVQDFRYSNLIRKEERLNIAEDYVRKAIKARAEEQPDTPQTWAFAIDVNTLLGILFARDVKSYAEEVIPF